MTDHAVTKQPGGRRRELEDEAASLRTRFDELRSSCGDTDPSPDLAEEMNGLEQRIAAIEEELARIELAVELERQQDA